MLYMSIEFKLTKTPFQLRSPQPSFCFVFSRDKNVLQCFNRNQTLIILYHAFSVVNIYVFCDCFIYFKNFQTETCNLVRSLSIMKSADTNLLL